MFKIGYQGIEGSNAETAAQRFAAELSHNTELVPLISSAGVVNALNDGEVDFGVMAVSNSITGKVEETEIALYEQSLSLCMILSIPIHHCLFKKPGAKVSIIDSHVQALKQTARTRAKMFLEYKTGCGLADTASGAKMLSVGHLHDTVAVLCSKRAGEMYGLELVVENLEDEQPNMTDFGIFSK